MKSISIWLTGLPGSGKTTLASALDSFLKNKGVKVIHLDGDKIRKGLCRDLGFSENERRENLRRVAEVNKLFIESGFVVINSFICPLEEYRQIIKNIVGKERFVLVFVNTPLEICEQRDEKGIYKKARAGEILNFTGISAPFEAPANPGLIIHNGKIPFDSASDLLIKFVTNYIASD